LDERRRRRRRRDDVLRFPVAETFAAAHDVALRVHVSRQRLARPRHHVQRVDDGPEQSVE
jgi:hypothetical protein